MSEVMEKQDVQSQVKELKINKLILQNFKGHKELVVEFNGKDARIIGRNYSGKSTVAEAWSYLLTGKDLEGKQCNPKTIDTNPDSPTYMQYLHNLEHSVTAEVEHNGQPLVLKKVFREVWRSSKSSSHEVLQGHTTDHYIDDLHRVAPKSEYDAKINEICDDNTLRMITDIRYVNEVMKTQDVRKLLFEVAGEVTDQEILNSNPDLQELAPVLSKTTIEKHRESLGNRVKNLNKKLGTRQDKGEIQIRIDETYSQMPDISSLDKKKLVNKQSQIKDAIIKKQNEKSSIESGGAVATKNKKLAELQTAREEESRKGIHKVNEQLNKLDDQVQEKKNELRKVKDQVTSVEQSKERAETNHAATKRDIEGIQENIKKTKEMKFHPEATTCYACGQELPQGDIENQEEQFNIHKAESLEELNNELKIKKGVIENYEAEIKEAESRIKDLQKKADAIDKECKALQKKQYELNAKAEPSKKQLQLEKQIGKLEDEIQSLQADKEPALRKVKGDIEKLKTDLEDVQDQLNQLKSAENAQKRIAELEAEQKEAAKEREELQRQQNVVDEFTRIKVNALEENINQFFEITRFKLFEIQMNKEVNPNICEALLNGTPYSQMSNSERILVGLDIVKTLQKHYGLHVPVFVDNQESIHDLPDMDCQVISLVVNKKHENLTVEVSK